MFKNPIRRAQLIVPFGVGGLSVLPDGTSVITAGLDHWFDTQDTGITDISEFVVNDWRLTCKLNVSEFRVPPDYRTSSSSTSPRQTSEDTRVNIGLTVPVLRFPTWDYCKRCGRLERATLTFEGKHFCPDPIHKQSQPKNKGLQNGPQMVQVPFVTICEAGHIGDFPFNEWVHRSLHPTCKGPLRLESHGQGLHSQVIRCGECHKSRSLHHIADMTRQANGQLTTFLSAQLTRDDDITPCFGNTPWLGTLDGSDCKYPMRAALRGAGNVYFPRVLSSIYLPPDEAQISDNTLKVLSHPAIKTALSTLDLLLEVQPAGISAEETLSRVLSRASVSAELLDNLDMDELLAVHMQQTVPSSTHKESASSISLQIDSAPWKFPEYRQIRGLPHHELLSCTDPRVHPDLTSYFSRIRAVDSLRETRTLVGFSRVYDVATPPDLARKHLRRKQLPPEKDWLPAYVVLGEGIYFELDDASLRSWENRDRVRRRVETIVKNFLTTHPHREDATVTITPRFVLLHTFAHVMMNKLVFTCGYSTAALRERLYASKNEDTPMAGVLIYTAAGDSEGTMGGLVRMSKPETLRSVIFSAIADAAWCSTDPVCMELGEHGQGPDSCNLAACHGCALVPETSCEHFNRFLDRALLIGDHKHPEIGYFTHLLG